jgi:uncharacterized protein (DUF433 family)
MAFPTNLASVLTGASRSQLRRWHRTGLLTPEISTAPTGLLYSFRDLVAVRTVVHLRASSSLQKVRQAFANLPVVDFTEHPSAYSFVTNGHTIVAMNIEGVSVDLVQNVGQTEVISLVDIFGPFINRQGKEVVDFLHPRRHLEVRQGRMSGWPTIQNTRVPYDTVARLLSTGDITPDEVESFYPGVSAEAARDARDFDAAVKDVA